MEDVLLAKEEGLRIAISILNGGKTNKDYGSASLKESELILKNILETLQVEKELMAKEKPKLKPRRKKPNKKEVEASMAYFNQILGGMDKSDKQGKTILDLERGK